MLGLFGRLRPRIVEDRPEQERWSLADIEALLREIAADRPAAEAPCARPRRRDGVRTPRRARLARSGQAHPFR